VRIGVLPVAPQRQFSITGTIVDSVVLAHDKPEATSKSARPSFTLSPYAFPSFERDQRTDGQRFSMQFGIGGRF